jgi:DNA anti-recombination protein RmuC
MNWLDKIRTNKSNAEHLEEVCDSLRTEIDLLIKDKKLASIDYDVKVAALRDMESKLAKVELEKKISEEDIKHMIKMKQEALEIEKQKFELKTTSEKQNEIHRVKDEYQRKVEVLLGEQLKNIQNMYSEVLKRLPNVEVMFGNKEGKKDK